MVAHNEDYRLGGGIVATTTTRDDTHGGIDRHTGDPNDTTPPIANGSTVYDAYWRSQLMAGLGLLAGFPPLLMTTK